MIADPFAARGRKLALGAIGLLGLEHRHAQQMAQQFVALLVGHVGKLVRKFGDESEGFFRYRHSERPPLR